MREQHPQPDLDGYTKNGLYGRVQDQILRLEAEGRKARAESFIVIPKQGIWRRMGRRTFYRLFGLHYISEEDDPVTRGLQAAINRAHSKIFIKDGTYYLNKAVQYPTNNPNSPSVLWYDFAKSIVLEGESPDAVLQIDGVFLLQPDDSYVNKPFLRLQTLTVEGVNNPGGFTIGGGKGGYFFFWDVTLTNVQTQGVFLTDFFSFRNLRIFSTQVGGPVPTPGGVNFSQAAGEIDGYYVQGFQDNALAFNNYTGGIVANNIYMTTGFGITPNEFAITWSTPSSTPVSFNTYLDNVYTNWPIAFGTGNTQGLVSNISIGRMQLAGRPSDSLGIVTGGAGVAGIHIGTLIMNNGYISVQGNVSDFTIRELDLTWSNPNLGLTVVSPTSPTQTGPLRIGKLTVNILQQPNVAAQLVLPSFGGTPFAFTVDVDELGVTVASGQGTFALNNVTAGSRVGRAKINGVPQLFPPNIIPNPPASGTTYLNNNGYGIVLLVPVTLTPTSGASASATISVGSSPNTLSAVQTISAAAGTPTTGGVLQAAVPSAYYYQISLTNATASQAIVLPE